MMLPSETFACFLPLFFNQFGAAFFAHMVTFLFISVFAVYTALVFPFTMLLHNIATPTT